MQNLIPHYLVGLFFTFKYLKYLTGFHKHQYEHYNVPRWQSDVFGLYYSILSANALEDTRHCKV